MSYGNGGEWNQNQAAQGQAIDFAAKNPNAVRNISVGNELDRTEKATTQLHAIIDQLVARLEPMLTPTPPAVQGSGGQTPEPSMSSIVRGLKAQGYRIDAATQRIGELLQRIEL